jgi:hypothetical protein
MKCHSIIKQYAAGIYQAQQQPVLLLLHCLIADCYAVAHKESLSMQANTAERELQLQQ